MFLSLLISSLVLNNISSIVANETIPENCAGVSVEKCEEEYPLKVKQCGVCGLYSDGTKNDTSGNYMIVDGLYANPENKYPWMVALCKPHESIYCAASIISDRFLLTSAHCVIADAENVTCNVSQSSSKHNVQQNETYEYPSSIWVCFLTSKHRNMRIDCGSHVQEIIGHPEFHRSHCRYDVALIKLRRKISCNSFRNPICLPTSDFKIQNNAVFDIAGWGEMNGCPGHSLVEGRIKLVDYSPKCKDHVKVDVKDVAYCLMPVNNSRPCYGDYGGPMALYREKKYYALGVASFHSCLNCTVDKPIVYASIPKVLPWIIKQIGTPIKP